MHLLRKLIFSPADMKYSTCKFKFPLLIASSFLAIMLLLSCENKIDIIPKSEIINLPTHTIKNFESVLNDSGLVQIVMSAPIVEQFDNNAFPYTDFKSGIKVVFWDGRTIPVGSVTSKYAKWTKTNNIWELRDSVVVLDENNVKLETELLFWNQERDLIYTDRFVKITDTDQEIQGYGFESDSHLQKRKIKKVRAVFNLKNEE
jgi:LPS export ABC transporter protein LptC